MSKKTKKKSTKKRIKQMANDAVNNTSATEAVAPPNPHGEQLVKTLQALIEQAEKGEVVGIIGVLVAKNLAGASIIAGHVTPQAVTLQLRMLEQQVVGAAINAAQQARTSAIV